MTIDSLAPLIRRAAKAVAGQWPGVIEQDDAEQAIYLRLLETKGSIQKIALMEKDAQYRAIVGIGHQLASQERTDYDHYRGAFTYSVGDVKELLKREVLTVPVDGFDAAVLDLMDGLEELVKRDIKRASKGQKPTRYCEAVVSRYADGQVPAQGSAHKKLVDALEALTNAMNGVARVRFSERDHGPGTRNQVTTSDHYEANDFDFEAFAKNHGMGWE